MASNPVVIKREPGIEVHLCHATTNPAQIKIEPDNSELKLIISSCQTCCAPIDPRIPENELPPLNIKSEPASSDINCNTLTIKKESTPCKERDSPSVDPQTLNNRKVLYSQRNFKRRNSEASNKSFIQSLFPHGLKRRNSSASSLQSQEIVKKMQPPHSYSRNGWQGRFNSRNKFPHPSKRWHKRPSSSYKYHHYNHHPYRQGTNGNFNNLNNDSRCFSQRHNVYYQWNSNRNYRGTSEVKPKPDKEIFLLRMTNSQGPQNCSDENALQLSGSVFQDSLKESFNNKENQCGSSNNKDVPTPSEEKSQCNLNLIEVPALIHSPPSYLRDDDVEMESLDRDEMTVLDSWELNEHSNDSVPSKDKESNQPKVNSSKDPSFNGDGEHSSEEQEKDPSFNGDGEHSSEEQEDRSVNGEQSSEEQEEDGDGEHSSEEQEGQSGPGSDTQDVETHNGGDDRDVGEVFSPHKACSNSTLHESEIEVVKQIEKDRDIECILNKSKEVHLCTTCFVERRRIKRNKEVIFVRKIHSKACGEDIPIINLEDLE